MSSENNNKNPNEKGYKRKLTCSQRVFDIITIRCIEEYKKHHPDRKGEHITQNQILDIISTFYVESY